MDGIGCRQEMKHDLRITWFSYCNSHPSGGEEGRSRQGSINMWRNEIRNSTASLGSEVSEECEEACRLFVGCVIEIGGVNWPTRERKVEERAAREP